MKIAFISNGFPPDYIGGAEISAFYSAYGLRQRGHDCSVLVLFAQAEKPDRQEYAFKGVPVRKVTMDHRGAPEPLRLFDPQIYRQARRELADLKPDLVHVHNLSGASLAPFLACRHLDIPVVVTLHDYWMLCPNNMLLRSADRLCDPASMPLWCRGCYQRYDFWGAVPFRKAIMQHLSSNVQRFISPSQRLIDLHVRAGYDAKRFRVVKYGIDLELFQAPMSTATRRLVDENAMYNTASFAGQIVEIKGMDVLAEALPLMNRYIDDFRLLIAGGGDMTMIDRLRDQAPDAVIHLGKLPFDELRPVYANAKLTLVPSIWYDNSPIVIYESLLMGTPVLGSRIGGIPELINEGETGYLFAPGNPDELAAKAITHFAQPARARRRMGHQCAEYANQNLTLTHHLDRLLAIYMDVVGS